MNLDSCASHSGWRRLLLLILVLATTAVDLIRCPQTLENAKAELREAVASGAY